MSRSRDSHDLAGRAAKIEHTARDLFERRITGRDDVLAALHALTAITEDSDELVRYAWRTLRSYLHDASVDVEYDQAEFIQSECLAIENDVYNFLDCARLARRAP